MVNCQVANDGEYVPCRVEFFACPNDGQEVFGGGEYKVFSNDVPDPVNCVPIYLGVKAIGTYPSSNSKCTSN